MSSKTKVWFRVEVCRVLSTRKKYWTISMPREKSEPSGELGTGVPFWRLELGTRLKSVIESFETRKKAAEVAGVTTEQLGTYEKGGAKPPFEVLYRLAKAKGFSLDWLATGHGPMRPAARGFHEEPAPFDGITRVPVFELRLSAGAGEPAWASEDPVGHLDVPTEFLAKYLRVNPAHSVAFPVVGDSMEPTIRDGELAVLDTSERRIERDGGVYAFRRIDELSVKRVFRRGSDYLLKADNQAFGEEAVPRSEWDEIQILGRVGGALRKV